MRAAALATLLLIAACSPSDQTADQPAAVTDEATLPQEDHPIIVPAGIDVVPVIASVEGSVWTGPVVMDEQTWTGGSINLYRRSVIYGTGTVRVDRTMAGSIYMVQVSSGSGDRCGNGQPLVRALNALAVPLKLPQLGTEQLARLDKAWAKGDGSDEVISHGILVRAVGGCVKTLVVKAV